MRETTAASSTADDANEEFEDYDEDEEGEYDEYEDGEYDEEWEEEEEEGAAAVPRDVLQVQSSCCSIPAAAHLASPRAQQLMESGFCMQEEEEYVDVGLITSCHGVRGEVKVQPLTDSPKRRFGRKGAK